MVAFEAHLHRLAELGAAARGEGSARLRVLGEADGLVQVALAIKASPPLYQGIVATLGELLADAYREAGDRTLPVAMAALDRAQRDLEQGRIDPADFRKVADEIVQQLGDDLDNMGRDLRPEVRTGYARAMAAAYTLGRAEVAKPLGWAIDFELVDQDAVHGLANSGLWWVGDAYGPLLDTPKLLEVVNQVALQGGLGREAAGEALAAAFGSQISRSAVYWRGLAATVATRARSFGALSSFEQHGGTQYEYVNPDDERTSEVCRRLNGTTFTVKGALDLRQRLLEAKTPEDWKAISPWPKPRDLVGADGKLLDGAALQAKGIAWPPLHFHCRSVIEVVAWLPADAMPDHELAPTPTPPPTPATKPKRAPRARKPKAAPAPAAPPAPPARTWAVVKGELAGSEASLGARGLAGDDYGRIGTPARAALFRYRTDLDPTNPHTWPTGYWRAFRMGPYSDELRGTAHVRAFMADLVAERARVATVVDAQRLAALDEAIAELRADLGAVGRHQALIREAAAKAPAEWRRKQRRKLVERFMAKRPSSLKAAEWNAILDSADEALVAMPDDLLHLLVAEGERYHHNGRNQRAHAMPLLSVSGYVEQDARTLITWGRLPDGSMGWLPDRVGRGQITLAHEAGHRLDGVFGAFDLHGYDTGNPWANHADAYPDVAKLWADAWGDPFDRQITRDAAGERLVVRLTYESQARNKHRYAGTWVREYEARIYHGGSAAPTAADLARKGVGGPVEFVSMGTEYVAGAQRRLRVLTATRAGGTRVGRSFGQALARELADTEIDKARYLYGAGYRDGVARLYRGGERQVRELIEGGAMSAATFADDADVITTAMALHYYTGADLETLLFAPDALLRPFLSNGMQGQSVVRTMVKSLLPSLTADPATAARELTGAYNAISVVASGSAVTDPPTAAALALAL